MRLRKKSEPEKSPEERALEERVEDMMDPKRPDTAPAVPAAASDATTVSANVDVKTAPQLSAKLRKQIAIKDDAAPALKQTGKRRTAASKSGSKSEAAAPASPPEKPESPVPAEEAAPETDPTDLSTNLDDSRTDEAVEDITRYESDVVLAVADATADSRSRQAEADNPTHPVHHVFSAFVWTLVFLMAVAAIAFFVLLVTGGNVSGLK
ncbi:MAG TPA: hypothetical protein VN554_01450 [Verrucomicrobiae bacterium]|nr:hypothetical protein [Verrucomicrobiae bacterium]